MTSRKLLVGGLATVLIAALPLEAMAAWKGLRHFNCVASPASWAFDGLYGRDTEIAVRHFQAAEGLGVDGLAGPATYRALGLKYHRLLRCGMGGNDVFALQQTLAAEGFWYGHSGSRVRRHAAVLPLPRPHVPLPGPKASPAWQSPPVMITPTPAPITPAEPSPEFTPPAASPAAVASPAPAAAPSPAPAVNEPTLEARAGAWLLPAANGPLGYDLTFQNPSWTAEATLWWGNWGLGGDLTAFSTVYTSFSQAPYLKPGTVIYDALVKLRFDHGYYQVFGGYRGLGNATLNFPTLGAALNRPLVGDWLWLEAKAQGGTNFGAAYVLDGEAGLAAQWHPVGLHLGFRELAVANGIDPVLILNGPTASLSLQF